MRGLRKLSVCYLVSVSAFGLALSPEVQLAMDIPVLIAPDLPAMPAPPAAEARAPESAPRVVTAL
jgi:hypothetical protein